jgi:hypothetical protein
MARRRFPYDRYGVPLLDVTLQAQGRAPKEFSGTVDSGASTTVLSIRNAEALGLAPADLRQAPDAIVADKTRVACWTAPTPIRAQILRPGTAAGDDEPVPWGPVFALDVMFMQDADPLWGQADFFATFAINFERPEFTLSY